MDALLWSFVGGTPLLNEWPDAKAIPSESETATAMSKALKERGFKFVGPKICYSLMQSCGLIIDHPKGTPEWEAARQRLAVAQRTDVTEAPAAAAAGSAKRAAKAPRKRK